MSYYSQYLIRSSEAMLQRVASCYVAEGGQEDPQMWASMHRFKWAAAPSWGAKWDSALAAGIEDPGADASVITDGDILATVQAVMRAGG